MDKQCGTAAEDGTILDGRTIKKLVAQIHPGCSECGWDFAVCDLHHISGQKFAEADSFRNLCWLCPNCHRLEHLGKLQGNRVSLESLIGGKWQRFYYTHRAGTTRPRRMMDKINENRREKKKALEDSRIHDIQKSGIDFSEFGWKPRVSFIIGISHTKVKNWMKINMPEEYALAFKRPARMKNLEKVPE